MGGQQRQVRGHKKIGSSLRQRRRCRRQQQVLLPPDQQAYPGSEIGSRLCRQGLVYFKGQTGSYWRVGDDGITADGDSPEGFYLELREPSKLCIKYNDGCYLMP